MMKKPAGRHKQSPKLRMRFTKNEPENAAKHKKIMIIFSKIFQPTLQSYGVPLVPDPTAFRAPPGRGGAPSGFQLCIVGNTLKQLKVGGP